MKTVGIIAEYDPFHNGHALQIDKARQSGAKTIIICLSTAVTQRGALPLLPESVRVEAALASGADMVVSLPAPYACSGAENFARGGVGILSALGCDTLVFGAETPNINALLSIAKCLVSDEYKNNLKNAFANGAKNFATARTKAVEMCTGDIALCDMLAQPNNNLALEYCKAILEQNSQMKPFALGRKGANHGEEISHVNFASGTALRELWLTKGVQAVENYVPASAFELYKKAFAENRYIDRKKEDFALLCQLRLFQPMGFGNVRGVSEGLEHRLASLVKTAKTAEELCDELTTVRYPRARMRRLCWDGAMQTRADIPTLPPYVHVLGAKKEALGMLKNCTLPVGVSLAKLAQENAECAEIAKAQARASDLFSLCRKNSENMGLAFTQKSLIQD